MSKLTGPDTSRARSAILGRLKAVHVDDPVPASDFSVVEKKEWRGEERFTRFRAGMECVNGEVLECDRDGWPEFLHDWLKKESIKTLAYGPGGPLAKDMARAVQGTNTRLVPYDKEIEDFRHTLFDETDAGITSTMGGIVDTGTLVLWPTPEEPRLLSLVPPIHIAVLDSDKLHNTFLEAMRTNNWADGMPTNALLVTGPSKTADIEQTLIYGVHGPKRLVVLLLK